MDNTRRKFLRHTATVAAGCTVGSLLTPVTPLLASVSPVKRDALPLLEDPSVKSLIALAIDASMSVGATYVDVRFTHWYGGGMGGVGKEVMNIGVRALLHGYWGFASGPLWSGDEMVRLGKEAVRQAAAAALGKPRETVLVPVPVVEGHWTMPVEIDPFSVHPSEIRDRVYGLTTYGSARVGKGYTYTQVYRSVEFAKVDKAFGSSDGSFCTQRHYYSNGIFSFRIIRNSDHRMGGGAIDFLDRAGVGFEMFDIDRMRNGLDEQIEAVKEDMMLPVMPVDVGKYDVIMAARPVAHLLSGTIGGATDLERALGYEADADGTSYLSDPFEMLGTFQVGSPRFTVTMNRSEPGGAATVQWDDEGVVPADTTLIEGGIVNAVQTTREGAGWMQEWAAKRGRTVRPTGSAYAPSAIDAPLAHTGNLVLRPASTSNTLDTLVSHVDKGVLFSHLSVGLDFQLLNGFGNGGKTYAVKKGKKVALLKDAGILFRTPELWKSLSQLGSAESAFRCGIRQQKGQPGQTSFHSVTAVPAVFTGQSIIDVMRKA